MDYDNPWIFEDRVVVDETIPPDAKAFVYLITNTHTGRKYIGKKTLFFMRSQKRKGKRRKRSITPSDWKEYYGSSEELLADMATLGNLAFRREIVRFCKSKGEASYFEAKLIFETDALLTTNYYNSWVSVRVRSLHLKNIFLENS